MESIKKKIHAFALNIYLNMPPKINADYVSICEEVAVILEDLALVSDQVNGMKAGILNQMLSLMESGDYVRMADYLQYQLMPFLEAKALDRG